MKRSRFAEEQIIGVLKDYETRAKTADLARKHGGRERHSTTGRPNTVAWTSPRPNG